MDKHEAAVQKIVNHVGQYVKPVQIVKVSPQTNTPPPDPDRMTDLDFLLYLRMARPDAFARGKGWTTAQIWTAPYRAHYVVGHNFDYFKELARRLGRRDLVFTSAWNATSQLVGNNPRVAVLDHALNGMLEINNIRRMFNIASLYPCPTMPVQSIYQEHNIQMNSMSNGMGGVGGRFIDRSAPRFGPGWVEFPVIDSNGRVHEVVKEVVYLETSAKVYDPHSSPTIDLDEETEKTRRTYWAARQANNINPMSARERAQAAAPSR